MEIERKFLIYRPNLLSELTPDEITQTYLVRRTEKTERRIRRRGTPETGWRYYYTEKTAVSAISRIENEREITPEEYQRLMTEADSEYGTIHKKSYCVPYQEQMLEIDVYDFGLTVLEIELTSEDDQITLPSWVRVIREVTGEKEYSNAGIARQKMQQNEIAKIIKERVVFIGTYLKYLETIFEHMQESEEMNTILTPLFFSLENSVYIELFKLFDEGKDAKEFSVNTLVNLLDNNRLDKKYHRLMSKHNKDIESIKYKRNKIFAHELNVDGQQICDKNPIDNICGLLRTVAEICCEADSELNKNVFAHNATNFKRFLDVAIRSIQEITTINNVEMKRIHERDIEIYNNLNKGEL